MLPIVKKNQFLTKNFTVLTKDKIYGKKSGKSTSAIYELSRQPTNSLASTSYLTISVLPPTDNWCALLSALAPALLSGL